MIDLNPVVALLMVVNTLAVAGYVSLHIIEQMREEVIKRKKKAAYDAHYDERLKPLPGNDAKTIYENHIRAIERGTNERD